MKKLEEIFDPNRAIADVINDLMNKDVTVIPWSKLVKEYDPRLHEIVKNKLLRPDKTRADGTTEAVARVTYGGQKLATKRMTQMAFSIPVKRMYDVGNDPEKKKQAEAIEAVYAKARINSENNKRMNAYFAACEICTVWYPVEKQNNTYGIDSKVELRCKSFSPMEERFSRLESANLYPLFDRYGRMMAMSFDYTVIESKITTKYFECYTPDHHYAWKQAGGAWIALTEIEDDYEISIKKHPLIYLSRPLPIWEFTTGNFQEIEFALSRESDIIKKNSAPLVKLTGKLLNGAAPEAEAAREVYQMENGGDIGYVTWEQQIDAMKFYIDTLKQNTEEELQLPNLSMNNVKSLGSIGYDARQTILTDAHLKVGDESGDIIEFFDRECNIIKAFLGEMNTNWKTSINDLKVTHIITPFIQNDEKATVERLSKATGGKAIMSQEEGVRQLNAVEDKDAEILKLKSEAKEDAQNIAVPSVFETAQ